MSKSRRSGRMSCSCASRGCRKILSVTRGRTYGLLKGGGQVSPIHLCTHGQHYHNVFPSLYLSYDLWTNQLTITFSASMKRAVNIDEALSLINARGAYEKTSASFLTNTYMGR